MGPLQRRNKAYRNPLHGSIGFLPIFKFIDQINVQYKNRKLCRDSLEVELTRLNFRLSREIEKEIIRVDIGLSSETDHKNYLRSLASKMMYIYLYIIVLVQHISRFNSQTETL